MLWGPYGGLSYVGRRRSGRGLDPGTGLRRTSRVVSVARFDPPRRVREAEGVVAPGAVHLHVFRHRTAAVHEGVMIGADAAPADPMIYLFIRQPVGFVTRALLVGF